jgi:hypothetical protein
MVDFHNREAVAEMLRRMISNRGYSPLDLVVKSGLPEEIVWQYINAERSVDVDELRPMCHALNISVMRFLLSANSLVK